MQNTAGYKEYVKNLNKMKYLKLRYLFACFIGGGYKTRWLRKYNVFGLLGDNVLYQPKTLPNEPKLVKIHNNVKIAADVTFYTHDVINMMLSGIDGMNYIPHKSCIEIMDNSFIGGHSIIIGDVTIGPNCIVAAGSVITKNVLPGTIVGENARWEVIRTYVQLRKCRITFIKRKKD